MFAVGRVDTAGEQPAAEVVIEKECRSKRAAVPYINASSLYVIRSNTASS